MTTTRNVSRAIFLDRDGVLVEDNGPSHKGDTLIPLHGVVDALVRMRELGFRTFVVTNQPAVARGLLTERDVEDHHEQLQHALRRAHPRAIVDAFRFCPHHPHADVEKYRLGCSCRKPEPGMLTSLAREWNVDLAASYMVGDRPTDVVAGRRASCRTVLVTTGKHDDPLIVSRAPVHDDELTPDAVFPSLAAFAAALGHVL